MSSQARGLQNFISDLRNAKGKVSAGSLPSFDPNAMAMDDMTFSDRCSKTPNWDDAHVTFVLIPISLSIARFVQLPIIRKSEWLRDGLYILGTDLDSMEREGHRGWAVFVSSLLASK